MTPNSPAPAVERESVSCNRDCPFCGESIPFWSDKAGKIMLSLGCFLALGYLFSIFYFWEDSNFLLFLTKGFLGIGMFFAAADKATRY